MKYTVLFLALISFGATAQTVMGPDAKEMFSLLTHPQVQDCLRDVNKRLINLEIKKLVARCPGCTTYTITGNELAIDVPRVEKTEIKITGKGVRSTFGGFAQTYSCEVSN